MTEPALKHQEERGTGILQVAEQGWGEMQLLEFDFHN